MATEETIKTSGELMWVRADTLTVDPRYQRPIQENKVRKIQTEFDPDAFGVLYVSARANGEDVILDGQQRQAAVLGMDKGYQLVPAIVYTGLTVAQEAALFTLYNAVRTKPRPSDMYRAALTARDPHVVAIQAIIDNLGLAIGDGSGKRKVQSIASVRRIYDNVGGDILHRALDVATRAWEPGTPDAYSENILVALAVIMARHTNVKDDRLVKVLMPESPLEIIKSARVALAQFGKVGVHNAPLVGIVGGTIVKLYNRRLAVSEKIKFNPDARGGQFWRDTSLPDSEYVKTKARKLGAVTVGRLFSGEQMETFYQMRVDGARWGEVHEAMRKASAEFDEANHDTDTARNAVMRYAENAGKPLVKRVYVRKVRATRPAGSK